MLRPNHVLAKPKQKIQAALRPKSPITYVEPTDPLLRAMVINSVESLTGRRRIEKIYNELSDKYAGFSLEFWEDVLARLEIQPNIDAEQLAKIPKSGPVVFVANHPYGIVDGVALCYIAAKSRGTFKLFLNSALCKDDRLDDIALPVNFEETREAALETVRSKKLALQTLKEGGSVAIFPAGGPSTAPNGMGMAFDMEWKLFTAKMIQMSKATVVPIYFVGQNSRLFQLFSHVNQTFRLALIIRELNRLRGKTVSARIGDPIPYDTVAHIKSRKDLLAHLREETYALGDVRDSPIVELRWNKKDVN